MTIDRRAFLGFGGAAMVAGVALTLPGGDGGVERAARNFPFRLTDAQWRRRLNPQQYAVLRRPATERPASSPLDREHRRGIFHCAGCGQPLFSSADQVRKRHRLAELLPAAAARGRHPRRPQPARRRRTEVLCARCGGHLGHVFNDGPPPTGLRYCMNGVAMTFRADLGRRAGTAAAGPATGTSASAPAPTARTISG